ncbi:binding-protein-dependent transport systems inner membrane component [Candidatus Vecturithrix granuli]|uniref:Binding-protein-dependent transport systems inner membrane component n=1 Tax=Vecturithrix granuli TaxID=1499967 RepID=A0A081C9Y1_VECG1|nr:binding-protein-dependent transport systems inner membrane component [Candidatus Vecturithrix granuli]
MKRTLKKILARKSLVIGGLIVLIVIGMAVFAPWLAPYHPIDDANLLYAEEPPGTQFWLGTDSQGRDVLSRIIYGARISLAVGLISQTLNSIIGVCLGLTAGFFGKWWDDLIMGLTNVMLAIPSIIFALAIMALLGPGLINVFLALGFTNWSYTCRITRSQVLFTRSLDYVKAAKALGYNRVRIMATQILPNIMGPILIIATLGVAQAILIEAALSFLGLGTQPPIPSWGGMLATARDQFFTASWISIFPGLAIFITVLGLNLFGDGLRDFLDPHTIYQEG